MINATSALDAGVDSAGNPTATLAMHSKIGNRESITVASGRVERVNEDYCGLQALFITCCGAQSWSIKFEDPR